MNWSPTGWKNAAIVKHPLNLQNHPLKSSIFQMNRRIVISSSEHTGGVYFKFMGADCSLILHNFQHKSMFWIRDVYFLNFLYVFRFRSERFRLFKSSSVFSFFLQVVDADFSLICSWVIPCKDMVFAYWLLVIVWMFHDQFE